MSPDEIRDFVTKNYSTIIFTERSHPDGYSFYLDDADNDENRLIRATRSSSRAVTRLKLVITTKLCRMNEAACPDFEIEYVYNSDMLKKLIDHEISLLEIYKEIRTASDFRRAVEIKKQYSSSFLWNRIHEILGEKKRIVEAAEPGPMDPPEISSVDKNYWLFIGNPKNKSFDPAAMAVGAKLAYRFRSVTRQPRNFQEHFQAIASGDVVFLCEASPVKRIVGMAMITRELHENNEGVEIIELEKTRHLVKGLSFSEIYRVPELRHSLEYLNRKTPYSVTLSIVTEVEFEALMAMIEVRNPVLPGE